MPGRRRRPPPRVGDPIPNTQPHKLNITANYTLPLPESVGKLTIGGTWVYTAGYEVVAPSCPLVSATCAVANPNGGAVPSSRGLNLSATWERIAGLPVDLSAFATNVTNEYYLVSLNDNTSRSFRSGLLGEPRMYGMRLRYSF